MGAYSSEILFKVPSESNVHTYICQFAYTRKCVHTYVRTYVLHGTKHYIRMYWISEKIVTLQLYQFRSGSAYVCMYILYIRTTYRHVKIKVQNELVCRMKTVCTFIHFHTFIIIKNALFSNYNLHEYTCAYNTLLSIYLDKLRTSICWQK